MVWAANPKSAATWHLKGIILSGDEWLGGPAIILKPSPHPKLWHPLERWSRSLFCHASDSEMPWFGQQAAVGHLEPLCHALILHPSPINFMAWMSTSTITPRSFGSLTFTAPFTVRLFCSMSSNTDPYPGTVNGQGFIKARPDRKVNQEEQKEP